MSEDITRIYELVDPRDGSTRYVGQTDSSLNKRLSGHMRSGSIGMKQWVNDLALAGLEPSIRLLDVVPLSEAGIKEIYWIQRKTAEGCNLLNVLMSPCSYDNKTNLPTHLKRDLHLPRTHLPFFNAASRQYGSLNSWLIHLAVSEVGRLLEAGKLKVSNTERMPYFDDGRFWLACMNKPVDDVVYISCEDDI